MGEHLGQTLFRMFTGRDLPGVQALSQPEFTRKLTYVEQIALHAADPAKYGRYLDWLFVEAMPGARRWASREFLAGRDIDAERERDQPGSAA